MDRASDQIQRVAAWFKAADNPYASAQTMRQLDGMIRNQLAAALAEAAARWRLSYTDYHRAMPPSSREHPFPPREQVARLNALRRVADQLSNLASTVRALPAPSNDRVWQRIRDQRQLLEMLVEYDSLLAEYGEVLNRWSQSVDPTTSAVGEAELAEQLTPITKVLRERSEWLRSVR